MFSNVNEASRHGNNFGQPSAGPQMNNPYMDFEWNRPLGAPGNNTPPAFQMWNVPAAPQFNHRPVSQQWNRNSIPQNTQSSANNLPVTQQWIGNAMPQNTQSSANNLPDTQQWIGNAIPQNTQSSANNLPVTQQWIGNAIPQNTQSSANNLPVTQQWIGNAMPQNTQSSANNLPDTQQWIGNAIPQNTQSSANNLPGTQQWIGNAMPQNTQSSANNLPDTQQWIGNAIPQNRQSSAFHDTFLKAKPKALGIVLIVVSILQIGLGAGLYYTAISTMSEIGIPFWGAIIYIIAGSLSIVVHSKPSIGLVKGSLGMNILTSICTLTGFAFTLFDLTFDYWYYLHYYYNCTHYNCTGVMIGAYTVLSVFALTYLLLFSVSVFISVIGCRALKHSPKDAPQAFVVQNAATFSVPPSAFQGSSPENYQSPPAPTFYIPRGVVKG